MQRRPRRPREHDGLLAVLVGIFDVLLVIVLGYGMVFSGIGAGFDEYADQRADAAQHGIQVFAAWLAAGGFALAAVLRYWKTGVVHLLIVGLPLLVFLAEQSN
ncbi:MULTISPECIES: hypothetical protein [unclassified Streptomyces]|uniref:hypothetical protein n=1 Tax=unclassified Streptomyces TaxID=2593676 RepID=UPI0023650ECA|nr:MULTISPECIES: hypothetical protein [unclassified Streptomyces]MDF3140735.1 hypothetical protein [Streptomyces sp. T21Q-yed]WDF41035.1 hypothetical protein PBV52_31760 [Streptomyces sp. T12]